MVHPNESQQPRQFPSTRWSVVLAAGDDDSAAAAAALQFLCESSWYPIYAFVRRRGSQPAEAEELTQGFFAMLLERNDFAKAKQSKGRFRTFLLSALKHYLANEYRHAHAIKRGGNHAIVSLDRDSAESRFAIQPAHELTPETEFHRQWALALLERVDEVLRQEMTQSGKQTLHDALRPHLTGEAKRETYCRIAEQLSMTAAAVKMAMTRLKQRYRAILRSQIAETVDNERDIDDEIRMLFEVLQHRNL